MDKRTYLIKKYILAGLGFVIIVIILLGFVHELGHIIFGILRGDKFESIGFRFKENGNIFSITITVNFDYNITTTDGYLLFFLGGYILAGIVSLITMFIGYYKDNKLLFHASWFSFLGQLSYMLLDSCSRIGDMGNVFWYLETIKGIEVNIFNFIVPILIGIVLFMVLVLYLTNNKLHFSDQL